MSTCPVCGATATTLSIDRCCGECQAVLQWFQSRLDLVGYRPTESISLESSFASDLAIDSLDLVEIICDLEHDFDVSVSGNDAINIGTVGDAIACVHRVDKVASEVEAVCNAPGIAGRRRRGCGFNCQRSSLASGGRGDLTFNVGKVASSTTGAVHASVFTTARHSRSASRPLLKSRPRLHSRPLFVKIAHRQAAHRARRERSAPRPFCKSSSPVETSFATPQRIANCSATRRLWKSLRPTQLI